MEKELKKTVRAHFPGGIGWIEISQERAAQILSVQKMIKDDDERKKQMQAK